MSNDSASVADAFPEERFACIVVGGGPAGMMAALTARACGDSVALLEKNPMLGRKLRITGKGRCNITNTCDFEKLIESIPGNGRFLYSCLSAFSNRDLIDFFERIGVKTAEERGGRVFPASGKAAEVAEALRKELKRSGVSVRYGCEVSELLFTEENGKKRIAGVRLAGTGGALYAGKVVLATGGLSYPLTGSTGDGYRFAESAGHTVVKPRPSLVSLVCKERWIGELEGLSLKNVAFSLLRAGKLLYREQGEMLFTADGVSGPIVLSASRHAAAYEFRALSCAIDLKPALTEEQLSARILRDFGKFSGRNFSNALSDLLPKRMIPVLVRLSGIAGEKRVSEITREERMRLVRLFKHLEMTVCGSGGFDGAIVTAGGVRVSEVNPKTMESRCCDGLFFAGELLDVDGYTGGFNLTVAFSTGAAAGKRNAAD